MHTRAVVISVFLFILIIAGMFIYAHLKRVEINTPIEQPPVTNDTVSYPGVARVDATHFYIDGVHTIVGEIVLPTPCDLLEANAIVAESFPEQVTIDFRVINNADACAQVETAARFMVQVAVSEAASFQAQFQGRAIDLNLIAAAAGQTPDEFELFIKG